jgi:hypothetical protein
LHLGSRDQYRVNGLTFTPVQIVQALSFLFFSTSLKTARCNSWNWVSANSLHLQIDIGINNVIDLKIALKTARKLLIIVENYLGEITPSYILHTRAFGTYLLGGIYLAKKTIRWWYFTCKNPKNIICDGILHVNMFHYFKIPYFTCNFFYKIYLQWIYWTLFFIARCSTIFAQWSPWEDYQSPHFQSEPCNCPEKQVCGLGTWMLPSLNSDELEFCG